MAPYLSTSSCAPDVGEVFLRGIEAAHQIASPQQLFVWIRLHLHRFVPHDLALICVDGGRDGGGRRALVYNCVPLGQPLMAALADPTERFWYVLAERWAQEGEQACWMDLRERPLAGLAPVEQLVGAGFQRMLVHGMSTLRRGQEGMVVAFLQRSAAAHPTPDDERIALDLWMPYLHFALLRSEAGAARRVPARVPGAPAVRALTARELQVLAAVREAKANAQIAVLLGISPLTVKNHLRSIQKKLGARNRVHAVAEAMSMRLIS